MKPISLTLFVRLLLVSGGFISSITIARALGPDGRGVFFLWSTIVGLSVQFGNLGFHSSNTYLLHKAHARMSELSTNSFWLSLSFGFFLSFLTGIIFYFKNGSLDTGWLYLVSVFLLVPSGLYFLLGSNLLVATHRFTQYNTFELVNRYSAIILVVLSCFLWPTPQSVFLATGVASLLVSLSLYLYMQKICGAVSTPNLGLLREGSSYGFRAYSVSILMFLVARSNSFLLDHLIGAEAVGFWSVAAQIFDLIVLLPSTFALVLLPKIMSDSQPYILMKNNLRLVFLTLCITSIAVFIAGRIAIAFLYGSSYLESFNILLASLPGAMALGVVTIVSQYLAAAGIPFQLIWIWLLGLSLEIILSFWLIPLWGGVGAMTSSSLCYIFICLLVLRLASSHNKLLNGCNP